MKGHSNIFAKFSPSEKNNVNSIVSARDFCFKKVRHGLVFSNANKLAFNLKSAYNEILDKNFTLKSIQIFIMCWMKNG